MKPQFLTDLIVHVIPKGYRLTAPLEYYSAVAGEVIIVPAGFVSDFSSIPAPGRIFISGHGDDRWAAVVHDYLYSTRFNRKKADAVFLEALEVSGVNVIKRRIMYRAVRTGGWFFYAKD